MTLLIYYFFEKIDTIYSITHGELATIYCTLICKIGFEEAQEIWNHYHIIDQRFDTSEQYRAIGWVNGRLYSIIFETRHDEAGEYIHLVTLWKATKQERQAYEERI